MYPLTVASKSQHNERVSAAVSVLKTMQQHSARLVAQADLVSGELIRVAILWYEMWHEVSAGKQQLHSGLWHGRTLDLQHHKPLGGGTTRHEEDIVAPVMKHAMASCWHGIGITTQQPAKTLAVFRTLGDLRNSIV